LGARVFMVVVMIDDDLALSDEGRPLHHGVMAFGGPTTPSSNPTSYSKCQNVTLLGHDLIFCGYF